MTKKIIPSLTSILLVSSLYAQDEKILNLEQITVTSATKTIQSIKDVTSNLSIITKEEIEEKHFTTVSEALNSVAGINYTSNGGLGATSSIYLRGAGNNRTLVLINGVRYQDPSSTSGASIQHLMIQDIEQIEIIKGAQSGIWGADASAGVINIITKDAQAGTHANASVEVGSFKTTSVGVSISHKASNYDVKLSLLQVNSDGFSVQAPRGEDINQYEDDAYENLTINLSANYYINKKAKLSFSVVDIDALKEYDSYGNPDDNIMKSDIDNRLYNLSYQNSYNNHNFTLKAQKSEFTRDEIGTVAQYGFEYVKKFNGEYNNLEFTDNIKYNQNDFLTIGFGTSSDDVDYELTDNATNQKKNKDNYIYLTNSNNFDKLIFTQSIRYDDYNNFDSRATGKIGAKYNINEDIFVGSNFGLAYNVPTILQELNPWGGSNTELNPEDTRSFDVSAGYKSFKATYFYNVTTDLIEWYDADGYGGNPGIYKNLDGESIFKGFEFEYYQNLTDEIYLTLNYTILSAKDKDGKELARRPKETFKASLDYYPLESLHVGIYGEYIGERYDRANKQSTQTGKYTVVNLVSNYEVNDNFSLYVKIDNLFDKYYQVVDGYATAPLSGYVGLNAKF